MSYRDTTTAVNAFRNHGRDCIRAGPASVAYAVLTANRMSSKAFSNLMSQYGEEAAQAKVREAKAELRFERMQRIRKICLLLMFLATMAAAVVFNKEVTTTVDMVCTKLHPPSPYAKAEVETKSKIADLKAQAEKTGSEIEDTYKQ